MNFYAEAARMLVPFQQAMIQGLGQSFESLQSLSKTASNDGFTWKSPQLSLSSDKLKAVRSKYFDELSTLWRQGLDGDAKAIPDRRFAGAAWRSNPWASFSAASHLLNHRTLLALVDAVDSDEKTRARLRFMVNQWMAASAPCNFLAFNAEAQRMAIETQGKSLARGLRNLLDDLRQGYVSMTDSNAFEVGRNLAVTEGAIVFENELFQLIEYRPLTQQVYERPLLMVPPCINKYYILDLQPENSFIRYAVEQGHRVFAVSWRNADESLRDATWDQYVEEALIRAIHTVQEISGSEQINTLGFCIGGTLLTTALAVLDARGEQPASSFTLLTTLLDTSAPCILDVYITEAMVRFREAQIGQGGLMSGSELMWAFSSLRPNDLHWNYVVGNYLKGETPPPFDLLHWNSDTMNVPGPFFVWYLRNLYLENKLSMPGALNVCGVPLDFRRVKTPAYIYGSRDDHIVPIDGAYAGTQVLTSERRFVMGASGHVAGVINPPASKKRSHWTRPDDELPPTQQQWLDGAVEHPGSWWTDWADWLRSYAGAQIPASRAYGRGDTYKAIEAAPGRYVKAKVKAWVTSA